MEGHEFKSPVGTYLQKKTPYNANNSNNQKNLPIMLTPFYFTQIDCCHINKKYMLGNWNTLMMNYFTFCCKVIELVRGTQTHIYDT